MQFGDGEVPETLIAEGERIARVQCVTCRGSVLDTNRDRSSAVRANAQHAKQQVVRIRTLLKSSEDRKRRKAACIEAFVKLLYLILTSEWPWAAGLED